MSTQHSQTQRCCKFGLHSPLQHTAHHARRSGCTCTAYDQRGEVPAPCEDSHDALCAVNPGV
jgi:hypothetical protein